MHTAKLYIYIYTYIYVYINKILLYVYLNDTDSQVPPWKDVHGILSEKCML